MHYVLYVPGMPFNGATIAQGESLGGSESAGYYVARQLARNGHEVSMFSRIRPEEAGKWEGVRYLPLGIPTQQAPHGDLFEPYIATTPIDVLIGQRIPGLFARPHAAKVTLWWTHDLALRRHQAQLSRQLWNLNGVLCVSGFHKAQVIQVYGLKPERVAVVPNGVERGLFGDLDADPRNELHKETGRVMVYSSRPERGLEHLLGLGESAPGIMERLAQADPTLRLKVCGYDNTTPELAGYYARLIERCRELPNVEWLGALSKADLARLMVSAWLHVYPTTFEEVSCITAMEAQCAGTPIVTSPVAALPETLEGAGVAWVPLTPQGGVDREGYARTILALRDDPERWHALHHAALAKAPDYDWNTAAERIEAVVSDVLHRQTGNPARMARHLMRHSDIDALRHHLETHAEEKDTLLETVQGELTACYDFARKGDFAHHYAAYYAYECARGVVYGPEELAGNPRFEAVSRLLEGVPAGGTVLDYGCAHGHYTLNLARRFPRLNFIGMDLVQSNIDAALAWAARDGLSNARFLCGTLETHGAGLPLLDTVIAAEVLEHTPQPASLADALASHLKETGQMVITTPYGPWEAQGFRKHHPWRAHLHHLEQEDLAALFGHHPGFALRTVPAGQTDGGEALGSYVTRFRKPAEASGRVDLPRKLSIQRPRETLSVCLLVRPESDTLARCLRSVVDFADEILLGVDVGDGQSSPTKGTDGDSAPPGALGQAGALASAYGAKAFAVPSPLQAGFDTARNATIERAGGDWILWVDDDEEWIWPERLPKYLRDNGYDAYAVKQHHFAVEPGGVIKTDYPCRLFRNRQGFRFYGLVHEHPELAYNAGAGHVLLLPDVAISHNGYITEAVRRERFMRNLPLMRRDRERHTDRLLGRFLWIRDLAHLNRFEYEQTGRVSATMHAQAEEGVRLWRALLDEGHVRLALDALPYYSECTDLLTGGGIEYTCDLGLHFHGLGDSGDRPGTSVKGQFMDTADIEALTLALLRERTALVNGPYV